MGKRTSELKTCYIERELLASEISKAKEPRLTQKEVSFINRLMVADRYGEDETIKTKNNTLNSEEWEALLVKLESELIY